jgi:hypothetical protein
MVRRATKPGGRFAEAARGEDVMKLWRNLWGRRRPAPPKDPTAVATRINPLLDALQQEVMASHGETLLDNPVEFVVPAVWGASKSGPLTPEQRRIHARVLPVVRRVHQAMGLERLEEPQRFAVDFLLRGFIINRLAYAVEAAKGRGLASTPGAEALEELEPMGTA